MSSSREAVVHEARSWLKTPYRDCADVKGAGVDCAMLLVRVFCDTGTAPQFDPRPYYPQWFLHSSEGRYLKWLQKYAHEVAAPEPGDVLLFNFGKHAAHGVIVVDDHTIIHAHRQVGFVTLDDRAYLGQRLHSCWSAFS